MAVPKVQPTIAQRFSVGCPAAVVLSSEGTAENGRRLRSVSRPFGTCSFSRLSQTLKRWATLGMSLRDKRYGLAFQFECEISRPTHLQRLRFGLNFISYMPRISTSSLTCILLAGGLSAGGKQKGSPPPVPTGYFQTPFSRGSGIIRPAVVSHLC